GGENIFTTLASPPAWAESRSNPPSRRGVAQITVVPARTGPATGGELDMPGLAAWADGASSWTAVAKRKTEAIRTIMPSTPHVGGGFASGPPTAKAPPESATSAAVFGASRTP